MSRVGIALVASLALGACDKDKGAGGDGDPRDQIVAAWKRAGLEPSAMTPATVTFGSTCQTGKVGAIDALLCVYLTPEEAKAAEEPALGWVGETTGAARAAGRVLVAVADRGKSDPSGRTINQLLKLAAP